ncbi:ABC1 kinase family protein [Thermovibrio sp.]
MKGLKRLWEVIASFYFCFYEELSRYLTPPVVFLLSIPFWGRRELLSYPPPVRLRVALESLGGAFVKIGQLLSTRVDILPSDFVRELEKLQDRVPPQPLKELLKSYPQLKNFFSYVEPEPIGSGSVAQVHRAILKSGREVALKVIRPQAERLIRQDISILKFLVALSSLLYPPLKDFRLPQVVEEIERMLLDELDLSREAAYMELFRKFSEKEPSFYVPEVFWEFTSTRYLVSEFIRGEKISKLRAPLEKRKELAERFVHIVHRTIFELGVFHGDLHPGNIFLLEDGRFAFVDFGIVGRLSPDTLHEFFLFSLGVMNRDVELIVDSLRRIGALPEGVNEKLLKREILIFLDKYYNKPLSQIDAEKLFYEELSTARKFKIVLPEELVVLMKTIAHTESIARLIYPDFRLPPLLKPYLRKMAPKFALSFAKRKTISLSMDYAQLVEEIPSLLRSSVKYEKQSYRELFWGMALLGFSVVLVFAPKLMPFYLPAVLVAERLSRR